MKNTQELISKLKSNPEIIDYLSWPYDFKITKELKKSEWFDIKEKYNHLAIAQDSSGGEYAIVEMENKELILYATSEGQAGVVSQSLIEFLGILLSLPYWRDILKFSGGGKLEEMQKVNPFLIEEYLEDYPEIDKKRKIIQHKLNIEIPESSVENLHHNVSKFQDRITVLSKDGGRYEPLFNTFTVESNFQWKKIKEA